jgi:cobalt/nickel transport system permease protein
LHIPDGFLTGQAALVGTLAGGAGIGYAVRRATREGRERDLPVAGLAAAFFLVADTPFFAVGVGTDGHLLGGTLAVALLGPWLGATTMAVVTLLQALVLGDGGITTLGLNVFNLALLPALIGYPLICGLRRLAPIPVACGVAACLTVVLGACCFVGEYALGSSRSIDMGALAGTVLGTYVLVGLIEGFVTGAIVKALLSVRPGLVRVEPAAATPFGAGP